MSRDVLAAPHMGLHHGITEPERHPISYHLHPISYHLHPISYHLLLATTYHLALPGISLDSRPLKVKG